MKSKTKKIVIVLVVLLVLFVILFRKWFWYIYQDNLDTKVINVGQDDFNLCTNSGDSYFYYENSDDESLQGIFKLMPDGSEKIIYKCTSVCYIVADEKFVYYVAEDQSFVKINVDTGETSEMKLDFLPEDIAIDDEYIFITCLEDTYRIDKNTLEVSEISMNEGDAINSFYYSDEYAYITEDDIYYYIGVMNNNDQEYPHEDKSIQNISVFRKDTGEKVIGGLYDVIIDNKLVLFGTGSTDTVDINSLEETSIKNNIGGGPYILMELFEDKIVASARKMSLRMDFSKIIPVRTVREDVRSIEENFITIFSTDDFSYKNIELAAENVVIGLYNNKALIYNWKECKYYFYYYDNGIMEFVRDENSMIDNETYYVQGCGEKVFIYNSEYCLVDIVDISN